MACPFDELPIGAFFVYICDGAAPVLRKCSVTEAHPMTADMPSVLIPNDGVRRTIASDALIQPIKASAFDA